MIKIYKKEDFKEEFSDLILNDNTIWDYPIEELDYLIEEFNYNEYLLLNNRLYDLSNWNIKKFLKGVK